MKGIHSPWKRPAPKEERQDTSTAPEAPKKGDVQFDLEAVPLAKPRRTPVSFRGRAYVLEVGVLARPADEDVLDMGKTQLGVCLSEILAAYRPALGLFKEQSIDVSPMLGPKVLLELGPLKLYAKASSMDLTMALRMAVDRLTLALVEIRQSSSGAKAILDKYFIQIVRQTA